MSKANKFILNGDVLLDLTQDTITENDVVKGVTFHRADGEPSTGTKDVTLQNKSVAPKTYEQTISPDGDKYGLSEVTVAAIQTETKSVTPTKDEQPIVPSTDKYLTRVTVAPIPDEYIVPSGSTTISTNGTHNVKNLEQVVVAVEGGYVPEWDGSLTITDIDG